jgi:hypothetical protein
MFIRFSFIREGLGYYENKLVFSFIPYICCTSPHPNTPTPAISTSEGVLEYLNKSL